MKYLGKSFSTPANSRAYVDGWERTFGNDEPEPARDDCAVEMKIQWGVPGGIWSHCAACEQGWPFWSDEWTDGSPSHKDPTSEHVVPCVKRRID